MPKIGRPDGIKMPHKEPKIYKQWKIKYNTKILYGNKYGFKRKTSLVLISPILMIMTLVKFRNMSQIIDNWKVIWWIDEVFIR